MEKQSETNVVHQTMLEKVRLLLAFLNHMRELLKQMDGKIIYEVSERAARRDSSHGLNST